jgi:hypothetical protein
VFFHLASRFLLRSVETISGVAVTAVLKEEGPVITHTQGTVFA